MTPIIMESDIEEVEKKLKIIRSNNEQRVHFDIGDGLLTNWYGVTPADLQALDLTSLEIDFHLLVDDPTEWIEECVALDPKRIIGQIERMGSQELFLQTIHDYKQNIEGGLALMIETPIESIDAYALQLTSVVLLLSVPGGTSGSKFDMRVINKIKNLREIYTGKILIDGGIDKETQKLVIEAGATEVGENSSYWKGNL
ncbi:MAG: hypothetical protein WCL07_02195 [bacterium]